jgi:CheY-like chemotaxis protein
MTDKSVNKKIIAVVDDLMFRSKIQAAASQFSVDVTYPKTEEELKEALAAEAPSLIIFDLGTRSLDGLSTIRFIKNTEHTRGIPVLSFFPHVDDELRKKAVDAGCEMVVPRSKFSLTLKDILSRYNKHH